MPIFSSKKPRKKTEVLLEQISTGKCDDLVVSELKVEVTGLTDPAEKDLILTSLKDIALQSGNIVSMAASIKALVTLAPMEPGLEDTLEIRVLGLITDRTAFSNRMLQEAIAEFLYMRVSERVDRAAPFVDTLIQFLDERVGNAGTNAYNTLMIVAANRPEYFQQHASMLIKMLGSINKATRIQTTRLIAVIAMTHPEYVAEAENNLLHLSSFNPDGEIKNSASEALQILSSRLRPVEQVPASPVEHRRRESEPAGGLADIMRRKATKDKKVAADSGINKKLLSLATSFSRKGDRAFKSDGEPEESESDAINKIMDDFSDIAESIKAGAPTQEVPAMAAEAAAAPFGVPDAHEEMELRRMMEKVKDDFSINASSILDAIGMGHLAKSQEHAGPRSGEIPVRDRHKRARLMRSDPHRQDSVPAKTAAEEEEDVSSKEFIASIESIISRTEQECREPAHAPTPITPPAPEPAAPVVADGGSETAAEEALTAEEEIPETMVPEAPAPVEVELPATPPELSKPEPPAPTPAPANIRPLRMPVAPAGVRISAMKFKSLDQSKSKKAPAPPKISIKPHIKPLGKPPADGVKMAPIRTHPMAGTPVVQRETEPRTPVLETNAGAAPGQIICHSCNNQMPEDSQRCAVCGSDLKSPKVRCRMCGEINPRGAGKCSRCGSGMDE